MIVALSVAVMSFVIVAGILLLLKWEDRQERRVKQQR